MADHSRRVSFPSPETLLVVVAGTVLVGSLIPLPTAGGVSIAGPFGVGFDKWLHAAGYAALAGVAAASRDRHAVAVSPRRVLLFVAVVAAVAAFGVGVEVTQSFVPGRTMSGADAVANTIGAVAGVVGWWLFDRDRRGDVAV